ncbi:MAG: GNAT family N-acetyltransferase [Actinomycetota bacterium]|nr:GNAT family N-acetyltransferase [Actinomycetota bacterium]
MKATVRSFGDADLGRTELEEKVGELRVLAYLHMPEVREAGFYSSVYDWFEGHPLADQVYRWVAITGEGRVVGHLSATPQYYRIGGRRVAAHTPGDYMVHPQYGFYALSLMRRFFRTCENCVACDMLPSVIGVETRLGAEEAGAMQYAIKLLDVARLPTPPLPASAARLLNLHDNCQARDLPENPQEQEAPPRRPRLPLPGPAKTVLNRGLSALDGALGGAFGGDRQAEVIENFDESFDGLFERVAAAIPCIPEKDAAFLRWRYGPNSPQHPVTVLGVREGGTLLGYAVLKTTIGMDGYILDLMALPGRRDVARALLREAVRSFRKSGTHIIRYRFQGSPFSARPEDLRRLGFFFRGARRNRLIVKFADPGLHETARDIANWSYNVGDGEASFWTR